MAQEKPRTVGEALEQARKTRAAAAPEARHQIVMEQIADALIGIQWVTGVIANILRKKIP